MVGDILVSVDDQAADNLPTRELLLPPARLDRARADRRAPRQIGVPPERHGRSRIATSSTRSLPVADADKNIVTELGILGVEIDQRIASTARGLRSPNGVIVVARVAGARGEVPLLPRDVIRSVNAKAVTSVQALREAVRALPAGAAVTLQIQRDGRLMYLSFILD